MPDKAPLKRENEIAFVTGPKGSGKSHLIDEYFTQYAPRVIRLDFVGDVAEKYPDMIEAVGYEQLIAALRRFNAERLAEWSVIAVFPEHKMHEIPELFAKLVPPYEGRGKVGGISRAFGGIALECTECDIILPNRSSYDTQAARNMMKRARHEALDLYLATQRPAECHRLCTAMADYTIALQTHEPRDLDYLSKGVGEDFAAMVRKLPRYHSAWFKRDGREILERDKDGEIVGSNDES